MAIGDGIDRFSGAKRQVNQGDADEIQMDQFRLNLQARWGKGFDALRMLIELSRDIGTEVHRRASRSRSRRRAHLNKALSHLHVRAIQIPARFATPPTCCQRLSRCLD